MRYCVNCGKQIQDDNRFCPFCGANQPELNLEEQKHEVIKYEEKKNESKASLVLGILSLIFTLSLFLSFVGVILGLIGLLKSKNGEYKTLNAISIIIFIVEALIAIAIICFIFIPYAIY